jgi:iron complex transport system ATP-binding protein
MSGNGSKPQNPTLIEARHMSFALDGLSILSDVSLSLHPGEMVGVIGPNGAGKSTLLRVLGGLWAGASGEMQLAGRPLRSYSTREVARIIAHVPQSTALDFAFTVREIVLMGRSPHLGRFDLEGPEDRRMAEEAMRVMAVSVLADRFINTLSGGERQRVFIARALAQQPRVLLLDEPTSNLDVRHQVEVLSLVARLAHEQALGVIAAVHNLDLAAHFCDRLVILHGGTVLADGKPESILTPYNLTRAFGVQAQTFRDPYTDALRVSLLMEAGSSSHAVG